MGILVNIVQSATINSSTGERAAATSAAGNNYTAAAAANLSSDHDNYDSTDQKFFDMVQAMAIKNTISVSRENSELAYNDGYPVNADFGGSLGGIATMTNPH